MTYNFDPELRPHLELLPTRPPADAPVDMATVRAYAAQITAAANAAADVSALTFEDRVVPGVPEAPDVGVRVYTPIVPDTPAGAILYVRGGGFTVGSVEMEHFNAARLANELGVVVASVEYRLAPENPFLAALHDCYAALEWVHANASDLGVDRTRVVVVGNSAGGGLAAGVALFARDRGGPPLAFQFLGVPELDDRLDTVSMHTFVDTPMWSRPSAEASWRMYLGDEHGGDVSPYAAPARATDLAGLPPAYVSTMEYDPLRDEGILHALLVLQAGVSVELHSFPGTWHGSTAIAAAAVWRRHATRWWWWCAGRGAVPPDRYCHEADGTISVLPVLGQTSSARVSSARAPRSSAKHLGRSRNGVRDGCGGSQVIPMSSSRDRCGRCSRSATSARSRWPTPPTCAQ